MLYCACQHNFALLEAAAEVSAALLYVITVWCTLTTGLLEQSCRPTSSTYPPVAVCDLLFEFTTLYI